MAIKVRREQPKRERDKKRNRLVVSFGNRDITVTRAEAASLQSQLSRFNLEPPEQKTNPFWPIKLYTGKEVVKLVKSASGGNKVFVGMARESELRDRSTLHAVRPCSHRTPTKKNPKEFTCPFCFKSAIFGRLKEKCNGCGSVVVDVLTDQKHERLDVEVNIRYTRKRVKR